MPKLHGGNRRGHPALRPQRGRTRHHNRERVAHRTAGRLRLATDLRAPPSSVTPVLTAAIIVDLSIVACAPTARRPSDPSVSARPPCPSEPRRCPGPKAPGVHGRVSSSRGRQSGRAWPSGPRADKLRTNGSEDAAVSPIALRTRAPSWSVPARSNPGVADERFAYTASGCGRRRRFDGG